MDGSFTIGEWLVTPALNQIGSNGTSTRVEPKAMQVLVYLAAHPGVVSKEELITSVWPDVFVSEDVLPGCISALRKAFKDNARRPTVIETIHKSGYRLLLRVANGTGQIVSAEHAPKRARNWHLRLITVVISVAALVLVAFVWVPSRTRYDSVAVLPFLNATNDPRTEYLSDGIAEQVVDNLSQLNAVKVMSWTTVSRYHPPVTDVRKIGRELGVRAILTGRLARGEERLILQTELVDVNNGSQLWGQRYEESIDGIARVQQQLSRDIVDNLRIRLSGDEQSKINHPQRPSPAYEFYIKGRYFWAKRNKEGLQQGINYFQQAIDSDPNYALAYAGLADCYSLLDDWGKRPPRDSFPQARTAAEQAIALDDSLAEAHVSLAMVRASYDWDWVGAEQEFRRAIELNPNYATAHQWYGITLASLGRFPEAERELKRARDLDPLSPIVNMGVGEVLSWEGRHDEAISQYKRVIELDPSFAGVYGNLGMSYAKKHAYAEAVEAMKKEEFLNGNLKFADLLGRAYAQGGFHAVLEQELQNALSENGKKYVNPVGIAEVYAQLGDVPRALRWLEKGYEAHASGMQFIAISKGFDGIRSDPGFRYWLGVLNLPDLTRMRTS